MKNRKTKTSHPDFYKGYYPPSESRITDQVAAEGCETLSSRYRNYLIKRFDIMGLYERAKRIFMETPGLTGTE